MHLFKVWARQRLENLVFECIDPKPYSKVLIPFDYFLRSLKPKLIELLKEIAVEHYCNDQTSEFKSVGVRLNKLEKQCPMCIELQREYFE